MKTFTATVRLEITWDHLQFHQNKRREWTRRLRLHRLQMKGKTFSYHLKQPFRSVSVQRFSPLAYLLHMTSRRGCPGLADQVSTKWSQLFAAGDRITSLPRSSIDLVEVCEAGDRKAGQAVFCRLLVYSSETSFNRLQFKLPWWFFSCFYSYNLT